MEKKEIKIALAGNPNTGKTSIFNVMVGAKQHVANYPGVTVEKKEGIKIIDNFTLKVIDLPGTYSLTAYSIEEIVTRDFIIFDKPDLVVNIIDGSNIERNLYLTVQLLELNIPIIVALNMADELKNRGITINFQKFSEIIGTQVISTVGNKGSGIDKLFESIIKTSSDLSYRAEKTLTISYGKEIDGHVQKIADIVAQNKELSSLVSPSWVALKLLENDTNIISKINDCNEQFKIKLMLVLEKSRKSIEQLFNEPAEIIIAEKRFGYVSGICKEIISYKAEKRKDISEKIDKVLTNRVLGIPIFLALMYFVFYLTFTLAEEPMRWIEISLFWISQKVSVFFGNADTPLKSLIIDGIIGGVGGVVVFLPNILILFFGIAILEDTGYMARAAFLMDRTMKWVGLHGKSFIPMLTGFGCTVPAVMATRCLDNDKDRLTTILVLPLMSCGARLPIYSLIIPAFFSEKFQPVIMWSIYITGILIAIISAKLLKKTLFKSETSPFVMELPPYRIPTVNSVIIHMWEKAMMYLKKAGTLILGMSIILWVITSYPKPDKNYIVLKLIDRGIIEQEKIVLNENKSDLDIFNEKYFSENGKQEIISGEIKNIELEYSVAGKIGKYILAPIIKPIGFDWKIGIALIGGLAAKEVFVTQLGIVHSIGETGTESNLGAILKKKYSKLTALCIMLFCLISAPCLSTIAITIKETNSVKWGIIQLAALTLLAYIITFIVYQTGLIAGIGI